MVEVIGVMSNVTVSRAAGVWVADVTVGAMGYAVVTS
jgi:hypothetical protein